MMHRANREPAITSDILKVYKEFLSNFQVDVQEIYRRAGFDQVPNAGPGSKIPLGAVSELLEISSQVAGEPRMALRFAMQRTRP